MSNTLIIDKKYDNVVFINYIAGTELFLLRCIHHIYKTSNSVDCVIVSINDPYDFEIDESEFFHLLNEITKKKFDLKYFLNPESKHHHLEYFKAFCSNEKYQIKDIVYLHEDCYIDEKDSIDTFFKIGRENNSPFIGKLRDSEGKYNPSDHMFYLNLEMCINEFDLNDLTIPSNNSLFRYLYQFEDQCIELDPSNYAEHRGNIEERYKVSLYRCTVFSDLQNYKSSVDWFGRNCMVPNFFNCLFMKQYCFLASKYISLECSNQIESLEYVYWMISEEVMNTSGTKFIPKIPAEILFNENKYNKDWNPPTEDYQWADHLEMWVKV